MMMGVITTGIISFTLLSVTIGYSASFIPTWLRSWGISYVIVIPCILIIGPLIEKLTGKLFSETSRKEKV